MQTIFSRKAAPEHSNWVAAVAGAASQVGGGLLEGACFGDKACQENRALQSQAQLTAAQAQLTAAQNASKQTSPLVIIGVIALLVVLFTAGFIFLRKKTTV